MSTKTSITANQQREADHSNPGPFITIAELAVMLKKSPSAIQKTWHSWVKVWGIRPLRFGGTKRGRLLFSIRDVENLLAKWSVVQVEQSSNDKVNESIPSTSQKHKRILK